MTAYGMRISDVSSDVCSSVLRTAIFGFSDLEKGVVLARFDEIPLGIDHEQARFGALDLAADDQRGAKDRFGHRPFVAMAHDDAAQHFADGRRDLEHRRRGEERRIGSAPWRERVCQYG